MVEKHEICHLSKFRKIRLNWKNRNELKMNELFDQRLKLSQNSLEMNESDRLIADQIYEKNRSLIIEQISEMTDSSTNLSRVKMWKIRQKVCPRYETDSPVAKIDSSGNLISNHDELKTLYVNTYQHRLRHRNMKENYSYLKVLKDNLFYERLELS